MTHPDYGLIVGQGRSGTNWLLELFDLSPETFCRNEPHGSPGAPLTLLLRDRWVVREGAEALERDWNAAAAWSCGHIGPRDHMVRVPKWYLHDWARRFGVYRAARSSKLRRTLGLFWPPLRCAEWRIPWWLGSQQELQRSLPVLKLVQAPGWAAFVLRRRPQIPVFHIVRHPGGFLNSWLSRYLVKRDENEVRRANQLRLRQIADVDSQWATLFGDIGDMSAEESELWYWRYANQEIHRAGQGSNGYHLVIYEDLAADTVAIMKPLYRACGLQWMQSIEREMKARSARSAFIADAWRDKLTSEQVRLVEGFAEAAKSFYVGAR